MAVLNIKITDAGRQALVDAENTGTLPLQLTQIALGSGKYAPTGSEQALQAEIKRLGTFGADVVAPDTIHVTVTDESQDVYELGEFGLYTNTGVLFAIYSQATPILQKAAGAMVLLSVDIVLTSVTPGSVTIGDTDFILPPASETRVGLVELATSAETKDGEDSTRAVHSKGLHSHLNDLPTPARFDSSKKVVNAAFVQRALGNFSAVTKLDAPAALTTEHTGRLISINTGGAISLPLAGSVSSGASISFIADVNNSNIAPSGANSLLTGSGAVTSITLHAGDTLTVTSDGVNWYATDGSARLQHAAAMARPNWTTPPQFDVSKRLATTEFVQQSIGSFSGQRSVGVSTALSSADIGKRIVVEAGVTVTLPSLAGVPAGSCIIIDSTASSIVTLAAVNGQQIWRGAVTAAQSVGLGPHDSVMLVAGAMYWIPVFGALKDKFSGSFGASLSFAGWQRLPSGLIIQWGRASPVAPGAVVTVTLPIAFPNSALAASCSFDLSPDLNSANTVSTSGLGPVALQLRNRTDNHVLIWWMAIGH